MCGEGHQLVILSANGTCPICTDKKEVNVVAQIKDIEISVNDEIVRIAQESKLIIEQFQKLLGVYTTTEALGKIAVLMREESEIEVELNKYKELVDWIYSIVSVNCPDVGEAHAGIQEGIEELRKETFPENVQNAKWGGHYETCPANNGGSCTC